MGARQSGQSGDLAAIRRIHFLNESTYKTTFDYLDKTGWDSDVGPHMSFVLRKNLDVALGAQRGEEFKMERRPPTS